jgi:hypothetical protein
VWQVDRRDCVEVGVDERSEQPAGGGIDDVCERGRERGREVSEYSARGWARRCCSSNPAVVERRSALEN